MVHLDNLDRVEMRGRDVSEMHHQHGANGEVWGDDPPDPLRVARDLDLVDPIGRDA